MPRKRRASPLDWIEVRSDDGGAFIGSYAVDEPPPPINSELTRFSLTPESPMILISSLNGRKQRPVSQLLRQMHEGPEGQVTFEMANLRPKTTGLPFVVWVSQKAGAQHDIRVKVGRSAKLIPSQMGAYSVRPFAHVEGPALPPHEERLLENWLDKNEDVLVAFWDADIEYTEDMIEKIQSI